MMQSVPQPVEASLVYPGYLPDLPDIVLMRRPAWARTRDLLIGTYALQICETPRELLAVQDWLRRPCTVRDLPDGRKTLDLRGPLGPAKRGGAPWTAGYVPAEDGWPWLVLVRLPRPDPTLGGLARELYATDAFQSESEWLSHLRILQSRWPDRPLRIPNGKGLI